MSDNAVFLVTEVWIIPATFEKLKHYKRRLNAILEKYQAEIIFHNHAFEWVYDSADGDFPSGIEIIKFNNEQIARAALLDVAASELKSMEKELFPRQSQ